MLESINLEIREEELQPIVHRCVLKSLGVEEFSQ